jgi:CHAT domain-containing protein
MSSDLLVLLACDVHGSDSAAGDAWTGMSRAFLRSSRSVVTSLWPIQEDAALAMTVPFWQALRDGLTAPQALRTAMLHLRDASLADLRLWGSMVQSTLPPEEAMRFHRDWTESIDRRRERLYEDMAADFEALASAGFGLDAWLPFVAIGWPTRLPAR